MSTKKAAKLLLSQRFFRLGISFLSLSAIILFSISFPFLKEELLFQKKLSSVKDTPEKLQSLISPKYPSFGLVIPKIFVNSAIIPDVDPFDPAAYQEALSRGVALAAGSAYPGQIGNVFLFSHSSANFLQATKYNSIFYLLDKLSVDDEVFLYYGGAKYTYTLEKKSFASPDEINYFAPTPTKSTLTLMTCWPPGTSLRRLIWQGSLTRVQ